MQNSRLIGQILDGKYQIERELGRGGMGSVYLATHLGTERPVAIKVIAPQFMERPEFVERFRREAKAAGRLRHPNVVDVTDFGFAATRDGDVAYLVMEYLDGCTLGEVLEEERNLPVSWTLDILEQVCSAVHEAHLQGIIHRDLKPDNIWLEPNQRGGYTVKVLDFGIAKLETHEPSDLLRSDAEAGIRRGGVQSTRSIGVGASETTIHDSISPTLFIEGATAVRQADDNGEPGDQPTLIQDAVERKDGETIALRRGAGEGDDPDSNETRLFGDANPPAGVQGQTEKERTGKNTSDLTRVGSVLGTPLYMSPEQCRGDKLDGRSDIYSIGVIAYQMLSGNTPFRGEFTDVMEAHRIAEPPPLNAKKVRKKLRLAVLSALRKEPDERPQTAEAFATILRSRSEGIFGLLRRAGMIYTEHIAKFLMLSAFFHLPMIVLTALLLTISILRVTEQLNDTAGGVLLTVVGLLLGLATAFGAYLIIGTITWIVSQSLAVPLRPIKLRSALREARSKWKRFLGTGILTTLLQLAFAIVTCGVGFLVTSVLWTLVGPVVMMENVKGWQAIKRSTLLVRRSLVTSIAAVFIMFIIPATVAGLTSLAVNLSARAITNEVNISEVKPDEPASAESSETAVPPPANANGSEGGWNISFGRSRGARLTDMASDTQKKLRDAVLEILLQLILLPMQIVMTSFTAIIVALLYLKTRQAGGESLRDLLARFEESDEPLKRWQARVRDRLIQSGRVTSRS
ncbi:MAG: serine/threonine protein kinase [Chloracidobacterium sp.]|nr:serine/threonine protein kinase [Chloracidobacterium sp.]